MERDYQMPSGNSWSSGLSDVDLGGSTTGSGPCEALPPPPRGAPPGFRAPPAPAPRSRPRPVSVR